MANSGDGDEDDRLLASFLESEILSCDQDEAAETSRPSKRPRVEEKGPSKLIESGIFSKIPAELIHRIFNFLSSEDLIACSLVCWFMNSAASDECLWRRLYCMRWGAASDKLRACAWKKLYIQRDQEDMVEFIRNTPLEFKEYYIQMQAAGGERKPESGGDRMEGGGEAAEPRDARVVKELLQSMGVGEGEYEPRVVHQFLELCYRYVVDVLSDAQLYSDHASKPSIDADDVRLAIQVKVNSSFSQPPPREVLLELARNRNKIPLPKSIAPPGGIPLPPDQDTLTSPNYQLVIPRKQPPSQLEETEEEEDGSAPNPTPNPNPGPNMVQEQRDQQTPQRVSFPLVAAAKGPPR